MIAIRSTIERAIHNNIIKSVNSIETNNKITEVNKAITRVGSVIVVKQVK